MPTDQPTIEAGVNAASVGDSIIIENYEPEIASDMQIINGKAVELLSEELYLNEEHKNKKTITLLSVSAERHPSIQAEVSLESEGDSSCPFPSPANGVQATLVERRDGGLRNRPIFMFGLRTKNYM